MTLPVEEVRERFLDAFSRGPVVLTAPTGTGKSTEVPRWLPRPVLIVQPRRVACRAVAARIAENEGATLGGVVGYRVRDENLSSDASEILACTPGVVLRDPALLRKAASVILDEFHERRLDTDTLLALLLRGDVPFAVMSATMDGDKLSSHIRGTHVQLNVRRFPVEISYEGASAEEPSGRELARRIRRVIGHLLPLFGDALVFLPGKGEIAQTEAELAGLGLEVLSLHGGLSLREQARVLTSSSKGRVILSSNVAETSLTLPSVRTVIDSGLVRRTHYHAGRAYLALSHIAQDSADQRAGRAGRTAAGACIRLWGQRFRLASESVPEIKRESLVPLLMSLARVGCSVADLRFFDPPGEGALADARGRLIELGAIEEGSEQQPLELTSRGRELDRLPLDPWLSKIIVEAEAAGIVDEAIALAALLQAPRVSELLSLFPPEDDPRLGCDMGVLFRALALGGGNSPKGKSIVNEVRASIRRLRTAWGLPCEYRPSELNDSTSQVLLLTVLKSEPRSAYVARVRKQGLRFFGGGTEVNLSKSSRVSLLEGTQGEQKPPLDAICVLSLHGAQRGRDRQVMASLASCVPLGLLFEAGLGEARIAGVELKRRRGEPPLLRVQVEWSFSGRVLKKEELEAVGQQAREAVAQLFSQGRLFPKAAKEARRRIARRQLAASLGRTRDAGDFRGVSEPQPFDEWLSHRLLELGVESGEDLELLREEDLLPAEVPAELAPQLEERYPSFVDVGDCLYSVQYDTEKGQAILSVRKGGRAKPPPASYLPRFPGFVVFVEAGGCLHQVRR